MPTANLKETTMERLAVLRGWLEIRDKKIYSVDDVIGYLLDTAPKVAFEIKPDEGMAIESRKKISESKGLTQR